MKHIIQCITNDVTKNDVANIILAVGASPIMAHHPLEVEEVQSFSSALLLNLGATFDYEAMELAAAVANKLGHPIVLDPVGIAGISYRREFALKLMQDYKITCVRGNRKEILALISEAKSGDGLDSEEGELSDTAFYNNVKTYAAKNDTILVASGAVDYVTDGTEEYFCDYGHEMLSRITGAGCMSSGVIASFLADSATYGSEFRAVSAAVYQVGSSGERAAELLEKEGKSGSGSFKVCFMDLMSM